MQRVSIHGERHPVGGPGQFLLGRAEALCPLLLEKYAEQVRLIYLDPPFGTGDTFTMRVGSRAQRVTVPAYADTLSAAAYEAMMRTVLTACYDLLTPDGSLYLHVDYRKAAAMRMLGDEIFGERNFVNEIIWAYKSGGRSTRHYARKHDTILFYRKSPQQYFHIEAAGVPRGPERRNHMKRAVDETGRVYYTIRSGGRTYTYHEDTPVYPSDVWTDIEHLHQRDPERTGYSTQKPEALLRRIIDVSSEPGDLVMDLFSGSGTTAAVAAQRDRAWLAADASPLALCTLRKRMLRAHRSFTLFDFTHDMALTYACNDLETPPVSITALEAGRKKIAPLPDASLCYLALGRREAENGGIFLPRTHKVDPREDTALLTAPGDDTLQAVDIYGNQGFWRLDL